MNKREAQPATVAEYIAGFSADVQATLNAIRATIIKAAPKAVERISYQMPFYEYGGKGYAGRFIYFAAFKKHISLFITPIDSSILPKAMQQYHVSKATYQFPLGEAFPLALLEKTVKIMVKERDKRTLKSAKK